MISAPIASPRRVPYGSNKAQLVALPRGGEIIAQDKARAESLRVSAWKCRIRVSVRPAAGQWSVLRVA